MNFTVQDVVKELCKMGLTSIVVNYDKDKDMMCYDLNTQAKSGLILYEDFHVEGRYGYSRKLDVRDWTEMEDAVKELFWEFENCICGRDYFSYQWKEVGVQLGLVSKQVETTTTVKYV